MGEPGRPCHSAAERRQLLLESLLEAVKKCQVRFGGKAELATETEPEVSNLCHRLELTLLHGVRAECRDQSLGMAVIKNVKDLVSNKSDESAAGIWRVIRTIVNKHEYQRYLLLDQVTTDTGRGRAWLRSSLNEQSLERYLHLLLGDEIRLKEFYDEWAFLRDQERASMLPSMAAGLASVRFALKVDNSSLNSYDESFILSPTFTNSFFLSLKSQSRPSDNPSVATELVTDNTVSTTKIRTKRKKKIKPPPAQIVSFDEVQPDIQSDLLGPAVSDSAPATCNMSDRENILFNYNPVDLARLKKNEGSYTSSPNNDNIYSSSHSNEDIYGSSPATNGNVVPGKVPALTPVTNKDIGDLFPIMDTTLDTSDDISPNPSDTDYAASTSRLGKANIDHDVGSLHSLGSGRSNSSLTRDNLKQALLSVIEKKEELEAQNLSLKVLLDQEMDQAGQLRLKVTEMRNDFGEQVEKLEARNTILTRENELLKHQLKKYVGAVQKLRDGPQAYETLAKLEGSNHQANINDKYIDYHFEASEYEKKLIQVAEMHGELLEFNENLQKNVKTKDVMISRMRDELVSLRGPLPDDQGTDPDNVSISSYSGSVNSRVLVNIWIPSVFLTGSGSARHHVYQVYVRIRDTEWNVYRRYSQFWELHQLLRKKDPVVNTFDFPPKKSVGNKSEKFVEDRRRCLQSYIRSIINYLVTTNVTLANSPDKETLLRLIPFFGEQAATSSQSQSATLSLFTRRRGPQPNNQLVL